MNLTVKPEDEPQRTQRVAEEIKIFMYFSATLCVLCGKNSLAHMGDALSHIG